MTELDLPVSIGTAGLVGRPQIVRSVDLEEPDGYDEDGEPIWSVQRATGHAIPPNCLRVLNSPLPQDRGGGCTHDCPGKQRDGSCLCDIVRVANAQEIWWTFEIDRDGYWVYNGPELKGEEMPIQEKGLSFKCPHCKHVNQQSLDNFHYWCEKCGLNGTDPKQAKKRKR